MPQESTDNALMTLRQACEFLNCHPNTLRKWDKSGYLTAQRIGSRGDRRYKRQDVLKILEQKPNTGKTK